jgi:hypothetical protein
MEKEKLSGLAFKWLSGIFFEEQLVIAKSSSYLTSRWRFEPGPSSIRSESSN